MCEYSVLIRAPRRVGYDAAARGGRLGAATPRQETARVRGRLVPQKQSVGVVTLRCFSTVGRCSYVV